MVGFLQSSTIPGETASTFVTNIFRFCYEVAELSWWERKMAATLFADPPTASMEEAKGHFTAAETLKPDGWIENRQFLAKCCINLQACFIIADTFLFAHH